MSTMASGPEGTVVASHGDGTSMEEGRDGAAGGPAVSSPPTIPCGVCGGAPTAPRQWHDPYARRPRVPAHVAAHPGHMRELRA